MRRERSPEVHWGYVPAWLRRYVPSPYMELSIMRIAIGIGLAAATLFAAGCGSDLPPDPGGNTRALCVYMTDDDYQTVVSLAQLLRDNGTTKAEFIEMIGDRCADATGAATPDQCEDCVNAVANLLW